LITCIATTPAARYVAKPPASALGEANEAAIFASTDEMLFSRGALEGGNSTELGTTTVDVTEPLRKIVMV